MVGDHQLHGLGAQKARTLELAAVEEHLQEAGVILGRGQQAGASGIAHPRPLDVEIVLGPLDQLESALVVGPVNGREAVDLGFGQEEMGVDHSQRRGDFAGHEIGQAEAGGDFDDRAQDVRVIAVDEFFAGLGVEGQGGQFADDLADGDVFIGQEPAADAGRLVLVRGGAGAVGNARGVGQQVAQGDRPLERAAAAARRAPLLSCPGGDGESRAARSHSPWRPSPRTARRPGTWQIRGCTWRRDRR